MIPHIVAHEQPQSAAEVLALAQRVSRFGAERERRWRRDRRVSRIERQRQQRERVLVLKEALRAERDRAAALAQRVAGLEQRVAGLSAMIDANPTLVPGLQVSRIVMGVAGPFFGVSRGDMLSARRSTAAVRQMICAVLRSETSLTLPQIGRAMGGRDHTTVLHALQVVAAGGERFARYPEFLGLCRAMLAKVRETKGAT